MKRPKRTRAPRKRGLFEKRINRAASPILATILPWFSIVLASVLGSILVIASAPIMPPLGFIVYLGWRQLRPGLLPIWAGIPLGIVDDLYSGQPFGSAVMLWSLTAIALEVVETRLPWRNFLIDWLVASALIALYILASLLLANLASAPTPLSAIVPQLLISIFVFPLACRIVALVDRIRLVRILELG